MQEELVRTSAFILGVWKIEKRDVHYKRLAWGGDLTMSDWGMIGKIQMENGETVEKRGRGRSRLNASKGILSAQMRKNVLCIIEEEQVQSYLNP